MLMKRKALTLILALLLSAAGACFVNSTQANPYHREAKGTEVSPPEGTQAPIITIHTPQNGSFYPKNLNLTFDVTIPETNDDKSISFVSKLYYKASWEPNEIAVTEKGFGDSSSFSIDLSGVRGGNHSITVYAVGVGSYEIDHEFDPESYTMTSYYETFEMTGFSTVSFTKDVVSPRISVLSPQNKTYVASDVELDFTVNEPVSQLKYSLDGQANVTFAGNTILLNLPNGEHNVTVYATDNAGNIGASNTIYFSVEVPKPFPTTIVATASSASVVVVSLGVLVYFKKHKR